MSIKVVGAGLGRTGTMSLKLALERLLAAPCYHMAEVFQHPEHVPLWHQAVRGNMPDWAAMLAGYAAVVDWPAASFYAELSAAYPEAVVVLSLRDAESWWRSASATIFPATNKIGSDVRAMMLDLFGARFTSLLTDRQACIAAYEKHVATVRQTVPAGRLVEWQPSDGWAPLCAALRIPVPDEAFPHENSTDAFKSRHS